MACRVGITTDPNRRKAEWQIQHPNLRNWQIIGQHNSRSAAQAQEIQVANTYNCTAYPGGEGPENAIWYVYYFEY